MRTFLLVGFAALALSLSGFNVYAATIGEVARNPNVEWVALSQPAQLQAGGRDGVYIRESMSAMTTGQRGKSATSVAEAIGTIAGLAGVGLVATMAAVGLRRVWTQDPIPDPLGDGPVYL